MLSGIKRAGLHSFSYFFLLWLKRDIRSKYSGSMGGLTWALVHPLLVIILYYFVFSIILKIRIPEIQGKAGYFYYLLAGILPFLSISEGISRASSALTSQEHFIKKVAIPVSILPISVILTSLVPQLVGTIVLIILLVFADHLVLTNLIYFPMLLAIQVFISCGLGLSLSLLSVHVRDITQIVPVGLQFFMYATPILYPKSMFPDGYAWLLWFNPLAGLIDLYQSLFLDIEISSTTISSLIFWGVFLGLGGFFLYRYLKPSIEDYL